LTSTTLPDKGVGANDYKLNLLAILARMTKLKSSS
jgi:hypothetical protein